MAVLWARELSGGYISGVPVFQPISFDLAAGETLLLLGANGAGKTTAILSLLGLVPYSVGTVGAGTTALRGPTWRRVREGNLAVALQRLRVFPGLTAREQLVLAAGRSRARRVLDRFEVFAPLRPLWFRTSPASVFSGGEQALLNLACAVASLRRPGVLCLDEPLANVSQKLEEPFRAMLSELLSEGSAALIADPVDSPVARRFASARTITVRAADSTPESLAEPEPLPGDPR